MAVIVESPVLTECALWWEKEGRVESCVLLLCCFCIHTACNELHCVFCEERSCLIRCLCGYAQQPCSFYAEEKCGGCVCKNGCEQNNRVCVWWRRYSVLCVAVLWHSTQVACVHSVAEVAVVVHACTLELSATEEDAQTRDQHRLFFQRHRHRQTCLSNGVGGRSTTGISACESWVDVNMLLQMLPACVQRKNVPVQLNGEWLPPRRQKSWKKRYALRIVREWWRYLALCEAVSAVLYFYFILIFPSVACVSQHRCLCCICMLAFLLLVLLEGAEVDIVCERHLQNRRRRANGSSAGSQWWFCVAAAGFECCCCVKRPAQNQRWAFLRWKTKNRLRILECEIPYRTEKISFDAFGWVECLCLCLYLLCGVALQEKLIAHSSLMDSGSENGRTALELEEIWAEYAYKNKCNSRNNANP